MIAETQRHVHRRAEILKARDKGFFLLMAVHIHKGHFLAEHFYKRQASVYNNFSGWSASH